MSAAQWSLWCTPKPDGAQAFAPTPHPATTLACLLTGPCQGDSQPPDQAGGSLPASLCLGAVYCVSLALSLRVPPWSSGPGASRGLPRVQSWQEMERCQALCPQTHKHSGACSPCSEAGHLCTDGGRLEAALPSSDLPLSAWSGAWSAGGGRGDIWVQLCTARRAGRPPDSAQLPQSWLLRA